MLDILKTEINNRISLAYFVHLFALSPRLTCSSSVFGDDFDCVICLIRAFCHCTSLCGLSNLFAATRSGDLFISFGAISIATHDRHSQFI